MAKHIKIKAVIIPPDFSRCMITLVEQTHGGKEFNDAVTSIPGVTIPSSNFGKAGFQLVSNSNCLYLDRFSLHLLASLFINVPADDPKRSVEIPTSMWPKVKAIVEAYNSYHTDEATEERKVRFEEYRKRVEEVNSAIQNVWYTGEYVPEYKPAYRPTIRWGEYSIAGGWLNLNEDRDDR